MTASSFSTADRDIYFCVSSRRCWRAGAGGGAKTNTQITGEMCHEALLFTGGDDGGNPYVGVILGPEGNLYGTADSGGASNAGVVFEIKRDDRRDQ